MRGWSIILTLFLTTGSAYAGADPVKADPLLGFLYTDIAVKADPRNFSSFLQQLDKKKHSFKQEKELVRYIFYKTHQKFLKNFQTESSFGELLASGKYNCLTGTALYALLFEHFDLDYSIIETNHHIFIIVKADGAEILIETTDPIEGFVDKPEKIQARLNEYRNNNIPNTSREGVRYEFSFNLWEAVTLEELTGLLYFNNAVKAYNQQNLIESSMLLIKAGQYKPSPRIEEFSSLLMLSIRESALAEDEKKNLLHKLTIVQRQHAAQLAAGLVP
ncbi:MAG: hypothetical protein EBR30_27665 [Cytophagia bacterium]|nr:hypothetical protein [Cytophagia bacterium]